ncbi:MAG: TatD family hydrolase [Candidatus Magasanikbacteria bacterium]|nr:TatD family hydrolase [Candidatus Magasanikbacteria bacterium]
MIDTHCHVQFKAFNADYDAIIKKCLAQGMILNLVSTQSDTSAAAVETAQKYDNVYATIGLHPVHTFETFVDEKEGGTFTSRAETFDYEYYKKLAQNKKVVGIGECGLELFHFPEGYTKEEVLTRQKEAFLLQYKLAREMNLAMSLHVREAHDEMIEILKTLPHPIRAVVHCFTSNWKHAEEYLKMGLYLGFTGVITFPPKKSDPQIQLDLLEVVKNVPVDRMVIETDAPYLAPNAYRGQRCEPWMVVEVNKKIAEVKNMGLEEVAEHTHNNAAKLFNIPV